MYKFLIVDDEATSRESLRFHLIPYGRCDLAYDNQEAIEAFRAALENQSPYDLVLLGTGVVQTNEGVLSTLRALEAEHGGEEASRAKVILTAARDDSEQSGPSMGGGDGCLTRPISRESLLDEVTRLLGELPRPKPKSKARTRTPAVEAKKPSSIAPNL